MIIGGAEGARTPDLMTASHALSQLSYSPKWCIQIKQKAVRMSINISDKLWRESIDKNIHNKYYL